MGAPTHWDGGGGGGGGIDLRCGRLMMETHAKMKELGPVGCGGRGDGGGGGGFFTH